MSKSYRSRLITGSSMLAIALSAPHAVLAQDTPQQAQVNRLEEITVTARRVEENIQRVPMSVLALSEDRFAAQNIVDLKDFQKITPGFNTAGGDEGGFSFMRGQQGIAAYFADAPYILGGTGQYFDVGTVQVLKGPQGTLFGASSASGAIVINPKKPTDTFEGFAAITVGDYGRRSIEGAVNIPAVEDKVLIRLAAQSYYRKGYVTDIATGKDYYDENYYIFRPSLVIRPTANVENYLMVQYYYSRNNGRTPGNVIDYNPFGVWAFVGGLTGHPLAADQLLAQGKNDPYRVNGLSVQQGFSGERERQIQVVNNTRWDIVDNIALTNIFSWRSYGRRNYLDNWNDGFFGFLPNDPRAIQTRTGPLSMKKSWSNETKFTGQLFDDLIDFTLGTFHSANPAKGEISWSAVTGVLTANKTDGDPRSPARTRAVFGQADIDIGRYVGLDGLVFTAGYRNTWNTVRSARTNYDVTPGVPLGSLKSAGDFYGVAHFSDNNWLLGLRYQYTPDTMFFITGSKGVTTGSVDPTYPPQFQVTQPESLKQIEGGIKSSFFLGDIQFRTNASAYYGWYSNIQVSVVHYLQQNPPPAPPTLLVISENAAEGLIRGIDADLTILPTDWFDLSFSGAYNKNKYTNWPVFNADGSFRVNRKRPYLGAPKFKYNITGTYHLPMDESLGKFSISATYSHVGRNWYFAGTDEEFDAVPHFSMHTAANGFGPLSADGARAPRDSDNPYHEVDISAKWEDAMGVTGLTATAGVTNLTKNVEGHGTGYGYHAIGVLWKDPSTPRMFNFGLKYTF
jgi:iron complex outermembrane receptor protein